MYVGSSCLRSSIVEFELKNGIGDEVLQYNYLHMHAGGVHRLQMMDQTIADI